MPADQVANHRKELVEVVDRRPSVPMATTSLWDSSPEWASGSLALDPREQRIDGTVRLLIPGQCFGKPLHMLERRASMFYQAFSEGGPATTRSCRGTCHAIVPSTAKAALSFPER
jgi:hypothetical protein